MRRRLLDGELHHTNRFVAMAERGVEPTQGIEEELILRVPLQIKAQSQSSFQALRISPAIHEKGCKIIGRQGGAWLFLNQDFILLDGLLDPTALRQAGRK